MDVETRKQLSATLSALTPQEFDKLVFALRPPAGLVPPQVAPQGDLVLALLSWAESPTGRGLTEIQTFLNRLDSLPSPQAIQTQSVALEPDQSRPALEAWYGREAELNQLTAWQADSSTRLIDVIGLGGYGKSSLAAKWLESDPAATTYTQRIWVNFTLAYPFRVFALWLLRELGHPKAEKRAASIQSIGAELDLGKDITVKGYTQAMANLRPSLTTYNERISLTDQAGNAVKDAEKAMRDYSERILLTVAVKYGKDSDEYEMAGGGSARASAEDELP